MTATEFDRDGISLTGYDFGGCGPPVVLLHGLAGYALEWQSSADQLVSRYRVFALDQRGHGDSDRRPEDVSRAAFAEDVANMIRKIDLGPVVLVGQSMGANTAMLTAFHHPELVRGLVMLEGSPDGPGGTAADIEQHFFATLSAWPVPFPDDTEAARFFESKGFDPIAWTAGLEATPDGLMPRWDAGTLARAMAEMASRAYWREWKSLKVPVLVIFGEGGMFPPDHGAGLTAHLPSAEVVTVPGTGHDVHLDAPEVWTVAMDRFLRT